MGAGASCGSLRLPGRLPPPGLPPLLQGVAAAPDLRHWCQAPVLMGPGKRRPLLGEHGRVQEAAGAGSCRKRRRP
eukprot:1427543-Alexandrium_andersonii.AAC.1